MYAKIPVNRYNKTLKMLNEVCPSPSVIFDLGIRNPFSNIMEKNNYKVYNTSGQDFDTNPILDIPDDVDLVTGFEIIEHLVSPYTLLKNINAKRIFLTVSYGLQTHTEIKMMKGIVIIMSSRPGSLIGF